MSDTVSRFIEYIKDELKKAEVALDMPDTRSVIYPMDNMPVNGYFSDDDMVLACATGQTQDKWLPILVHEYAHFTQWQDKCDVWVRGDVKINFQGKEMILTDLMWEWVGGNDVPYYKAIESIHASRELEADCERRTVELIKKFNLPIPTDIYAKKSNAYIYFYNAILKYRKWYEIDREPYNIPEILEVMPDKICKDFNDMPYKWMRLYEKFCFGEK